MRARKVVITAVLAIGTLVAGGGAAVAAAAPATVAAGHVAPDVYMHS
jgi:hypothetical protein